MSASRFFSSSVMILELSPWAVPQNDGGGRVRKSSELFGNRNYWIPAYVGTTRRLLRDDFHLGPENGEGFQDAEDFAEII